MQKDYIVTGETTSGFKYEVDMRIMSDMAAVRKISRMFSGGISEGEQIALSMDYYDMILGKDQVSKLEEHIRTTHEGFCPSDVFDDEVTEILSNCKPIKK